MPRLEIVTDFERLQRRIDMLQRRFPDLRIVAKSAFFCILACELDSPLTENEKAWLQGLIDTREVQRYRCKEWEASC
jgi:hypothetical protein